MEITEIRVKLVENPRERLLAFCTLTFHREFVVRDVKIIDGPRGPFVAMPSRKVMDRCDSCSAKNHLRARFCNECGHGLSSERAPRDARGRPRLHVDVAHPINQECRSEIEGRIIAAYEEEQQKASQPGYIAPDLEDTDDFVYDHEPVTAGAKASGANRGGAGEAAAAEGSSDATSNGTGRSRGKRQAGGSGQRGGSADQRSDENELQAG